MSELSEFAALDWTHPGPARRVTLSYPVKTVEEARRLLDSEWAEEAARRRAAIAAHPMRSGTTGYEIPPHDDPRRMSLNVTIGIPNVGDTVAVDIGYKVKRYRIGATDGGGTHAVLIP